MGKSLQISATGLESEWVCKTYGFEALGHCLPGESGKKAGMFMGNPAPSPEEPRRGRDAAQGGRRGEKSNIWLKKKLESWGIAPKTELKPQVGGKSCRNPA